MRKPIAGAITPPDWTSADVYAMRALRTGTASEAQQKRALDWIIQLAARTYDVSYSPASDRDTSFAEGRRFVGLQIVKLLNMPAELFTKGSKPHDGG